MPLSDKHEKLGQCCAANVEPTWSWHLFNVAKSPVRYSKEIGTAVLLIIVIFHIWKLLFPINLELISLFVPGKKCKYELMIGGRTDVSDKDKMKTIHF